MLEGGVLLTQDLSKVHPNDEPNHQAEQGRAGIVHRTHRRVIESLEIEGAGLDPSLYWWNQNNEWDKSGVVILRKLYMT